MLLLDDSFGVFVSLLPDVLELFFREWQAGDEVGDGEGSGTGHWDSR